MIPGLLNVSLGPKINISHLWRLQDTSNNLRKTQQHHLKIMFIHLAILEIHFFGDVGKDGHRTSLKIRLKFLTILNLGPISSKET